MGCCIDNGGMWGRCIKYSEACLKLEAQQSQQFGKFILLGVLSLLAIGLIIAIIVLLIKRKEAD